MEKSVKYKIPIDYFIIFGICMLFILFALSMDTTGDIWRNYLKINCSRSVLVTDYIALAGLGAALLNSALACTLYLLLLIINKREPDGKVIAALFVTMGFSLFGKNLFNTIPIILGVWLYGKFYKVKFSDLLIHAMFGGTIAPIVSEIAFLHGDTSLVRIIAAYGVGLFIGFIFPVITESAKRMHRGYCLYNGGTAGGFIATFFVGLLRSVGIDVLPENIWNTAYSGDLAALAFTIATTMIIYGIFKERPSGALKRYRALLNEKDINDNDYFIKYGCACYINIGVMCILSISLMLFLKIPINGPVLGGILTVAGFGAAGKHFRNSFPILIGSVAGVHFNYIDTTASVNSLAVLFSTGLAPVCGKHGWQWGIVTGFLHVSVAIFIGQLNGGLNLYNNGFAGAFVTITLVPVIVFFKEIIDKNKNRHGSEEGTK